MMKKDTIQEIAIDDSGKLIIRPESASFPLIWRSSTEVHWNPEGFLYSPKPREWSYLDWFKHIIEVARDSGFDLIITESTQYQISPEFKSEILDFHRK